jgi:hypothetical protein
MWFFPKLAEWQVVQSILRVINPDYVSPIARRELAQKQQGNPAERQTEQRRIAREDSHYRQGFPVAGHGGPEQVNNPKPRQRPKLVP